MVCDSYIVYLSGKFDGGKSHSSTAVGGAETPEAKAEAQEARSLVLGCTVETLVRLSVPKTPSYLFYKNLRILGKSCI